MPWNVLILPVDNEPAFIGEDSEVVGEEGDFLKLADGSLKVRYSRYVRHYPTREEAVGEAIAAADRDIATLRARLVETQRKLDVLETQAAQWRKEVG